MTGGSPGETLPELRFSNSDRRRARSRFSRRTFEIAISVQTGSTINTPTRNRTKRVTTPMDSNSPGVE